jgi:hypothetical protein
MQASVQIRELRSWFFVICGRCLLIDRTALTGSHCFLSGLKTTLNSVCLYITVSSFQGAWDQVHSNRIRAKTLLDSDDYPALVDVIVHRTRKIILSSLVVAVNNISATICHDPTFFRQFLLSMVFSARCCPR